MKIRLVGVGYDKFNGAFGEVEFKDGVSVSDVSPVQARLFAAITSIENADDGIDPGANAQFQSSMKLEAVTTTFKTLEEALADGSVVLDGVPAVSVPAASKAPEYTQEKLEAIADKGGIAGLREIADPIGVKGTSITALIKGILAKQAPVEPEAATLPEGQPDVVTSENAKAPQE